METIIPITDLQQKTRKYVQQVRDTGRPIIITQRGRAAVVMMTPEDFEGYLLTRDELSYPGWRERLETARRDLDAGKGASLSSYKKKRAKRRRG